MGISVEIIHKVALLFHCFQIELEFRNVGFCGGRKTGVPGENLPEQGWELTTKSTHIHVWQWVRDSNPGHISGSYIAAFHVNDLNNYPDQNNVILPWNFGSLNAI